MLRKPSIVCDRCYRLLHKSQSQISTPYPEAENNKSKRLNITLTLVFQQPCWVFKEELEGNTSTAAGHGRSLSFVLILRHLGANRVRFVKVACNCCFFFKGTCCSCSFCVTVS